jgi:hypothetical protein
MTSNQRIALLSPMLLDHRYLLRLVSINEADPCMRIEIPEGFSEPGIALLIAPQDDEDTR